MHSRTIAGSSSPRIHTSAMKNPMVSGNARVWTARGTRAGQRGQRIVAKVPAAATPVIVQASMSR